MLIYNLNTKMDKNRSIIATYRLTLEAKLIIKQFNEGIESLNSPLF